MILDKRLTLTLLATALAAGGCSDRAVQGENDGPGGSAVSPQASEREEPAAVGPRDVISDAGAPTTSSEYKLPAQQYDDVLKVRKTELWARVYRPATLEANRRYPLLIFLHGNHGTCGSVVDAGDHPRYDIDNTYTFSGTCPPGMVVAPSHEGYAYIANDLAASGYIVVSINANLGITGGRFPNGRYIVGDADDQNMILARGRLVLKHLQQLSEWHRGVPTTVTDPIGLRGHIDFDQVGLLGHSRGGEGVRAAYALYKTDSTWPTKIATDNPIQFRGIFEIAPTDGAILKEYDAHPWLQLNAVGTRWAVMLPMCDGDVSDLEGKSPFDRMQLVTSETTPSFKSTIAVWGANHNYFNTEWQNSDSVGCMGAGNEAIFETDPGKFAKGSDKQQLVGNQVVTTFFRANVGANRDPSLNALFVPTTAVPPALTKVTPIDRGFLPAADSTVSKQLEGFALDDAGTTGDRFEWNGATGGPARPPEHDGSQWAASVKWEAVDGGAAEFFQINFGPPALGISLSSYAFLDFGIDRADDSLNSAPQTDFTIQLVYADGTLSLDRKLSAFGVTPKGPVGTAMIGAHQVFQTVRIPLAWYTSLEKVRGIRFTFDPKTSGAIYVANLRAAKGDGTGYAQKSLVADRDVAARDLATVPTAPRPRPTPTTFVSARLASLKLQPEVSGATGGGSGLEIEIVGPTPISVEGEAIPILRIGTHEITASGVDPNDLRRVRFTLPAKMHRALRGGEEITVLYRRTQWNVGRFDRAAVTR